MTKKMTMEEVAQYLIDEISGEFVIGKFGNSEFVYYLPVDDQGQPITTGSPSESFSAVLDERAYVDYPDDEDWRDDVETLDNKYFLEVVETIYEDYSDWYDIDREKTADEWTEILESLNDEELIDIWNEYTGENNDFDSHIFHMHELDAVLYGLSVMDAINALSSDFNGNCEYFVYGIYGIESFDNPANHIYISDIVDAIIDGSFYPSNVDYLF